MQYFFKTYKNAVFEVAKAKMSFETQNFEVLLFKKQKLFETTIILVEHDNSIDDFQQESEHCRRIL